MFRCIDDSTALLFVTGRLDGAAGRNVEEELARCARCVALVAEVVRGSASLELGAPTRTFEEDNHRVDAAPAGGDGDASRYVLGDKIARGGMGTILAAYDRRLGRSVAIKCLDSDKPMSAARFLREIRVTASLQHPGIVPIYDSGALPDGRLFYAMRHVPGASMARMMADSRDENQRLDLLVSVLAAAEAVGYAHEQGIVHRDLKPSNILVGPFGETVVIDWGLARIDGTAAIHDPDGSEPVTGPATTQNGAVLGTPRYMAPEQARGEPATRRSDVYALGAILYHVLAGVPAVEGDEVAAVLERVARADIRPLAQAVPGLPGDLTAIVERAMRPSPDGRYASAGELAADLRRFQAGQLVAAHAYSWRELLRRFLRRHRTVVALASLFTVVLAFGGALSIRSIVAEREETELQRQLADRQRQAAVGERGGAEALVQFMVHELRGKLARVGRLDVLSGVADRVESYYLTAAAGRADLPEALIERASLYELRAAVASSAGDGAAADSALLRGFELIARTPSTPRSNEVRAALLAAIAQRATATGQLARARTLHLESAALYGGVASQDAAHRRELWIHVSVELIAAARLADQLGNAADAEATWSEARATLHRVRSEDPDSFDTAWRLADLDLKVGQSRFLRGLVDQAQRSLEQALAEANALTARNAKDAGVQDVLAWTLLTLADVHKQRGTMADAHSLYERALEVARAMVAIEPASATWQRVEGRAETSLGQIAAYRADWATAARRLEAAHHAYDQLVARDPTHRGYRRGAAIVLAELAEAESALGRASRARRAWGAALVQLARLAESEDPASRMEWAYGLRGYAAFERRVGQLHAMRSPVEHALAIAEATPDLDHRPAHSFYRAAVYAEVGFYRAATGRVGAARAAWQRAASLLRPLAAAMQLDPDGRKLQRELESALGARNALARRR